MLNPEMSAEEIRLHMGELTPQEVRTARAAIRWANSEALNKITRLKELMEGMKVYVSDMLVGPINGDDDRKWYKDGFLEIVKRIDEGMLEDR